MKILYIAHRIPYPPNKGDKIRSFNEIKHLARNHELHLFCLADNPDDLQHGEILKTFCKSVTIVPINPTVAKLKSALSLFSRTPLSIPYFYSSKLQRGIDDLLASTSFGCIFCFSSPMAAYIFRSPYKPLKDRTVFIMDFVDVDSDKWNQYSHHEKWPLSWIYRIEAVRLARFEQRIAKSFNHSVFVSKKEVSIFADDNFSPLGTVTVIPNGVDYEYFSPSLPAGGHETAAPKPFFDTGSPVLLFTGAMDYYANVDGVLWFTRAILPRIRAEYPDTTFWIVGSNPHPGIRALDDGNRIRVTGYVEDIRPYYQAADICVVPLRLARGVQNKVLEAMAMAKPVVVTTAANQGIEAVPGEHLLIADTAEAFAGKVLEALRDNSLKTSLGKNSRDWIKTNYNWQAAMGKLEGLLRK